MKTQHQENPNPRIPEELRTRCEVWTRVMGYHRPVSQFNKGKKNEHRERLHFSENPTPVRLRKAA